ncbi:trimethylamine methyltransferase family protein [Bacilliculturomica massiliensis]|uniref:trimethylamine methyltransferase family protein n=1 Tax=Bacilliculturomica massiliensis TaxID=1917867 RepID=UPI001031E428|nr:trimethylamine methyltransferase family protein [Bacilliculturomica massiliensis]
MKRNFPIDIEFRILDQEKIEKIHRASLRILEEVGIKVTGERMRGALAEHGAVMEAGDIVKIPSALVEKALATVPEVIRLYNRDGEQVGELGPERNIYFGSIAEQLEYLDYKTNTARRFTRDEMKIMCTLQDYLPNIAFTTSVGILGGVPAQLAGQIGFIEVVRNFTKNIHVVTSDVEALKDIVKIAADLAGGPEALAEKPLFVYYAEPIPPLLHPYESNERIAVCAEHGIPFTYMPYSMMGGTGPITQAGILAQNNAEVLAGLVMSQVIRQGAPYIYGSMPTVFDMKTTIGSYGAPEFHLNIAAAAEMAEFYGIPFYGSAAISDAKTIDPQSAAELEMTLFSAMLSKAGLVHDVGLLDHCRNISPMAIYLANEIIEQLKYYVRGVDVSDETLLLDVIGEVGPGGHYLEHVSTLKNFKKYWYPKVFERNMVNPEKSDLLEKGVEAIDTILATHVPAPLAPEKEAILARHEAELLSRVF